MVLAARANREQMEQEEEENNQHIVESFLLERGLDERRSREYRCPIDQYTRHR